MIAEMHHKLGKPERVDVTRIVLRADNGEAICVAMQVGPENYFCVHRGDGDENMVRALRSMGINETIISEQCDLPKPPGKLWTPGD
jgi:hypothetical protein